MTCRGPSQPIFLWFFTYTKMRAKYGFLGQQKDILVLLLADFLILTIFFLIYFNFSSGDDQADVPIGPRSFHNSRTLFPEKKLPDQILPFHI